MRKYLPRRVRGVARNIRHGWKYWIEPVLPLEKTARSFLLYIRYFAAWWRYRSLPNAEPLRFRDGYPCLFDAETTTPYDPHYFYQAVWAMERIVSSGAKRHIDVGSDVRFVGMLTTHLPVAFVDLRPFHAKLHGLSCLVGTLLALPFADNSMESLSCLHVAEHVGLGRYGDDLDPSGTRRACTELARVLAPHGNLFFSVPVGKPRVCFNAHKIHSPRQILEYLSSLDLIEFSVVDDRGNLRINAEVAEVEEAIYSCGLFWLQCRGG